MTYKKIVFITVIVLVIGLVAYVSLRPDKVNYDDDVGMYLNEFYAENRNAEIDSLTFVISDEGYKWVYILYRSGSDSRLNSYIDSNDPQKFGSITYDTSFNGTLDTRAAYDEAFRHARVVIEYTSDEIKELG